jgi:hypothetical protein
LFRGYASASGGLGNWTPMFAFHGNCHVGLQELSSKRYNLIIEEHVVDGISGKLIPLLFWYGRTHVAYTEYYTHKILTRELKTGDHLEELLGVAQLEDIKQKGMEAHAEYGNFVLDEGNGEVIYHLTGLRA